MQRRRLALLALLATCQARGRGLSRERLVAYLWPEADPERGRPLLSDSVYRINQAVGGEAIVATGDELRLNDAVVSSDVAEFERAAEAGERERAAHVYAGPLLDGLYLVNGAEFERWLDGERARLARAYEEVLDALAQNAEANGSPVDAVAWWRRLATHDPYSSRVALRLMQALAAVGDSAAAIRHATTHTALLQHELGVAPNAAVLRLAERLKTEPVAPAVDESPSRESVAETKEADHAPASMDDGAELVGVEPPPNAVSIASPARPLAVQPRRSSNKVGAAIGLALAAVVVLALAFWQWPRASAAPAASIAVLPFTDMSPGHDNAYFSDGMTEELINTLAQVQGVRVAAHTSVFAYKDGKADVRDVGRKLGVATVLEGSVRKAGDKIRITVQLANAADGFQLWSESYDRELDDVFAIQEDISRSIVTRLRGQLVPEAPVRIAEQSTQDADAYDLYLKGRYAWHERTEAGLRRAAEFFQQAVARAPQYARAYVGLGDAYAVLGFYDYLAPRESFPSAEQAAHRALAIDSTLAAPYATLGYVEMYHHWNWAAAEELFQRSIALDPSYSTAHQWYANLLTVTSRFGEAENEMRVAQERDPLSLIANAALGWTFYYAGDYKRAIAQCDHTLELNNNFQLAHLWKGWALEASNEPRQAVTSISQAVTLGRTTLATLSLAHALAAAGNRDSAQRVLAPIEAMSKQIYVPAYEIAKVHLVLGHTAEAMRWLDRAFDEQSHSMAFLRVDPQLASLRDDPRFQTLVRRVNREK